MFVCKASLIAAFRPTVLARHVLWLPLIGLTLGLALPSMTIAARALLGPSVFLLVFSCVAATEIGPPNRSEVRAALLMTLATCIACPLVAGILAAAARLPDDLAFAVVLAATSPVAIGAGTLCRRFGLPERPAVWAALSGLVFGPALLPLVGASAGAGRGEIALNALTGRAAMLGAAPALIALLFRRSCPKVAVALSADFRGVAVIGLSFLALCAGGTAGAALRTPLPEGGSALLVILAAAIAAPGVVWATARLAPPLGGRGCDQELFIVSGARNLSFIWASALGMLTWRAQAVLAVAVAGTFVLPAVVYMATNTGPLVKARAIVFGLILPRRLSLQTALATFGVATAIIALPNGVSPDHRQLAGRVTGPPSRTQPFHVSISSTQPTGTAIALPARDDHASVSNRKAPPSDVAPSPQPEANTASSRPIVAPEQTQSETAPSKPRNPPSGLVVTASAGTAGTGLRRPQAELGQVARSAPERRGGTGLADRGVNPIRAANEAETAMPARCRNIMKRVQLGEALSDDDRGILRAGCNSG